MARWGDGPLAVFFEVVIGLGGHWDGAAVLILTGLVLLGRRLLVAGRP